MKWIVIVFSLATLSSVHAADVADSDGGRYQPVLTGSKCSVPQALEYAKAECTKSFGKQSDKTAACLRGSNLAMEGLDKCQSNLKARSGPCNAQFTAEVVSADKGRAKMTGQCFIRLQFSKFESDCKIPFENVEKQDILDPKCRGYADKFSGYLTRKERDGEWYWEVDN